MALPPSSSASVAASSATGRNFSPTIVPVKDTVVSAAAAAAAVAVAAAMAQPPPPPRPQAKQQNQHQQQGSAHPPRQQNSSRPDPAFTSQPSNAAPQESAALPNHSPRPKASAPPGPGGGSGTGGAAASVARGGGGGGSSGRMSLSALVPKPVSAAKPPPEGTAAYFDWVFRCGTLPLTPLLDERGEGYKKKGPTMQGDSRGRKTHPPDSSANNPHSHSTHAQCTVSRAR